MRSRAIDFLLLAGLLMCANYLRAAQQTTAPAEGEQILVGAGKTHLLDMPNND